MEEIKRCSRCILPRTFTGIRFTKEGVCSLCQNKNSVPLLGEKKLLEILRTRESRIYDCVVPLSGGKDSTYVLYYAVKTLKLRVLAVNYDSGFMSDLAKQNMENACKTLKVPLVIKRADYKNRVGILKEALRISQVLGTFLFTCANCEVNIRSAAVNTAKENGIPFILFGSTEQEKGLSRASTLGPRQRIKAIFRRHPFTLSYHMIKFSLHSIRERIQMNTPVKYRFRPMAVMPFPEEPKVIYVFDYIKWDPRSMRHLLKQQVGWSAPVGDKARFDCFLHCFENHRWLKECGISIDGFVYSTMIRENLIERKVALDREKQIIAGVQKECSEVLRRLGLRDDEMPMI